MLIAPAYYFMSGLNFSAQGFFFHWFVLFIMVFVGSSLGMLIGSLVSDVKSVMPLISFVIVPLILFAGYFKNRHDLPSWAGWIEFISPIKYSFIAFLDN
jgi:ABC-type multidrug transport system permease subunit